MLEKKFALRGEKRKRSFIYIMLLFLFLSFVLSLIYLIVHRNIIQEREIEQFAKLEEMHTKITQQLNATGIDLTYYAHSDLAIATLENKDQVAKNYLASLMYKISALHKRYDQIRLFDEQGNEVIRIDQASDLSLHQIPEDMLQNKKERYYFQNALTLSPEQIYVSNFDLNKEFGKVELPIKPMIRFITPIYSKKGEHIGIGIINYKGEQILNILNELNIQKEEQVFLINSDGFYLKGKHPEKDWGFMFPERAHFRFSTEHPDVWKAMKTNDIRKLTNANGEYYFRSFHLSPAKPFNSINSEDVFLVMHVPIDILHVELENLLKGLAIGFLLIAPMLSFLAYKLAYSQVEQEWLFKKLNFEARHDALTGLHNRPAIVDYLEKNISLSRRRKSPLAIAFIDINDLKKMNDLYGHEAGDELIKGLASAIGSSIRESDFAARLGGDEFLIVCIDCDKESVVQTMLRIQDSYVALGRMVDKKWSMSFGCAELIHKEDDVDSLIERADSEMYKHKKQMKQNT